MIPIALCKYAPSARMLSRAEVLSQAPLLPRIADLALTGTKLITVSVPRLPALIGFKFCRFRLQQASFRL